VIDIVFHAFYTANVDRYHFQGFYSPNQQLYGDSIMHYVVKLVVLVGLFLLVFSPSPSLSFAAAYQPLPGAHPLGGGECEVRRHKVETAEIRDDITKKEFGETELWSNNCGEVQGVVKPTITLATSTTGVSNSISTLTVVLRNSQAVLLAVATGNDTAELHTIWIPTGNKQIRATGQLEATPPLQQELIGLSTTPPSNGFG
jgi:hypothetical protein